MTNNSSSHSGGIGFIGLLTIAFIVLKLTHYIDWSWWYVLAPIWGGFLAGIVFLLLYVFFMLLGIFIQHRKNKKNYTREN